MIHPVEDQNQKESILITYYRHVCCTCVQLNTAAVHAGARAVRSRDCEAVGQSTQQPGEHTRCAAAVAQ